MSGILGPNGRPIGGVRHAVGVDPIADMANKKRAWQMFCAPPDLEMQVVYDGQAVIKRAFAERLQAEGTPVVLDNIEVMFRPSDEENRDIFGTQFDPGHQDHPHIVVAGWVAA